MIFLFRFPLEAQAASEVSNCGGAHFEVTTENRGHPLDNKYALFGALGRNATTKKLLYVSDVGGWFYAACIEGAGKSHLLLFQAFCGGSACVEDKFGIVDTDSLKILLEPGIKNEGNSKAASKLLRKPVPYLPDFEGAFCCGRN